MLKYEKITFLARKVAPKPEEVSFWIDISADPYGRIWKYWDGDDWQPLSMGGSGGAVDAYSKAEADLRFATASTLQQVADDVTNKQDTLVSGVNIRTINSQSVLGSGDIRIDVGLTQSQVESIVNSKVSGLVDSAPTTLDTLKEIATALNNDPAFATTITTLIGLKVNTVDYESDKANLATKSELANKADTSELSKYITTEAADAKYALKGEGGDIDLSDYLTTDDAASTYATKTELSTKADETDLQGKQDTLVSGTNIKTINNQSVLGTGNIEITTGTGGITDAPSDSKLYGRLNSLWAEVPTVDTSSFATQSALTSGLASKVDTATYTDDKATFALKSEIPDTSDFVSKDGGQMHADANLTFRSASGDRFSMNSSGVKTTAINGTGWGVNLSFSSLTFSDNEDEPGKGARYDAYGVEIYDKTENDLLHAGGGTTKLKTINNQSLLGEGNIEITSGTGGISDAPSDNKLYGRKNAAWSEVVIPDTSNLATKDELASKANTSDLSNYLTTASAADTYATKSALESKLDTSTYTSDKATFATTTQLAGKQDTLVSGTNIKTVNGLTILGEGNIQIETPEGGIADAPSDGSTYGRKDGAWTLISTPDLSSYATQEYVNTQVSNLVNSAPEALNTLDELAAALGDDANFATTVTNSLASKAALSGAEFTGTIGAPIVAFTRESQGMMGAIQADSNNILFRTYNAGVDSITFLVLNTAALKVTEAGIWENNQLLENKYAQLSDLNDFATTAQLNDKQDTLVSGTNIKTINGETVLGSGDITISSNNELSGSYAAGTATAPVANDTYEQAIAKLHAYVNEHATDITSLQSDVESITGRDTTLRTTSLSNVSNEHNYVIAPISSNLTLSFVTSNWSSNTSVHIFVYNSSSSEITVTIPNTGSYVNMSSEVLTIPGNTGAEIDAFKDSYNNIWIRHAVGELTITPTTVDDSGNDDHPLG